MADMSIKDIQIGKVYRHKLSGERVLVLAFQKVSTTSIFFPIRIRRSRSRDTRPKGKIMDVVVVRQQSTQEDYRDSSIAMYFPFELEEEQKEKEQEKPPVSDKAHIVRRMERRIELSKDT